MPNGTHFWVDERA